MKTHFAATMFSVALACASPPQDQHAADSAPEPEYIRVNWPWCEVPIPPILDSQDCPAHHVGRGIDPIDVCRLMVGLRDWLHSGQPPHVYPGEYLHINSISVCASGLATPLESLEQIDKAGTLGDEANVMVRANLSEQPGLVWASLSKVSGEIRYGVPIEGEEPV